jgi:hypothetical protein
MITAKEANELAVQHNYERTIYEKARMGHFEARLVFVSEAAAVNAKKCLNEAGFVCSKIDAHYAREGTDYSFVTKWDKVE